MVTAADLRRYSDKLLIAEALKRIKYLLTEHGMRLHYPALLRSQSAVLSEYILADADLSDIVQRRCKGYGPALLPGEMIFVCTLYKTCEQQLGYFGHIFYMPFVLAVSKLDNMA